MRIVKILIFSSILFGSIQITYSQKLKFSSDTAYLNELMVFMNLQDKKEPDPLFTQFTAAWNGGQIKDSEKQLIVSTSNNLVKKRAKVNPHFTNFLKLVLSILNSKTVSGEFALWIRMFENYSTNEEFNIARLDQLMENLILLNDSSVLFQSRAVKWKITSQNYKLIFDSKNRIRIDIPKTDLICFAKRDSSVISNTSGQYYPISDTWMGKSGMVTWERAGFSKDSVNAKLNNYRVDLKFSEFKADTVEFTNKKYLKSSLIGKFEDKVMANITEDNASYPKFLSHAKTIDIKQVVPNIDFSGGFRMEGAKFYGYGDIDNKAELFIYKDKDLFAKASALVFVFDKNNIIANNAKVIIKIDQDTLWHPGLNFNYLIKNERVALNRSGGGLFRSKFFDTYHKMEIDISEISFNLADSMILFKSPPATTYRKAIFESGNYFTKSAYDDVAMMDTYHPLEAVRKIAPSVGEEFEAIRLAVLLNKGESYAINMLTRLSDLGFVHYDVDTKYAYPKQKLFDFIKNHYGKRDYDEISIVSEPSKGNNAELNLKSNILTVYGVKSFVLSNSKRVGVIPDKSQIRIKKNLEIDFDGQLQAGLAWIHGKKMTFDYDSFLVRLNRVDSLALTYRSETKTKDSLYTYTNLTSTIDSISGLLKIDKPENKSGVQKTPVYPILESHGRSYVFYEQQTNKDTVYKKENFYVENYPFEIDSLYTILAKNISFKGTLKSGGVFPDFDENLVVQEDNSLGFIHKLDSIGMPVYQNLAKYENTIKLDNRGLKGDGKIEYLNTSIYAARFNFFPDSMNTYASRIEMLKQNTDSTAAKFPAVVADSVYIFWAPKRDQMLLTSLDKPFDMFESKADLKGTIELNTDKLEGKGVLNISDAQLNSKTYTFYDESFKADTADFLIRPVKGKESPFLTYNVNANVDFDKKFGLFNSNGRNSYIDLPVSQYKCYMNYFSWHMGINQIDIGATYSAGNEAIQDVAVSDSSLVNAPSDSIYSMVSFADTTYTSEEMALNSRFVSTHPGQDSLTFYATSGSYDINNYIIKAKGVKFIPVADAIIYPSGHLTIFSGAKLKTLQNARILANRESSYHKFYDATIDVLGAKKYLASADYEYYDRNDSLQIVHFSNIGVNSEIQTVASGEIEEKALFKMSPEFAFMGKIMLKAPNEHIEFDGFTKIKHLCDELISSYWLQFKTVINPDSIVIPLAQQPVDNEFRKLQTSLFLTTDSVGIYPGFLITKKRIPDIPVLNANGFLSYNVRTGYYEIADSAKLANPEMDGNYLSFHRKLCLTLGEGKFDLGANLGQVKLTPAGFLRHNMDAMQTQLEIMLGVDFFFSDPALNKMAEAINESYTLPPVNITGKEYTRAFKELVGYEQSKNLMKDFALIGGFSNIPAEMNKTLFFSNLKMKWNLSQNAWQSEGKIGLGNIKGIQVNKLFDGYIEVKKLKSGDILNIYLEISPQKWYFFTYTRGTLKTISWDNDYNSIVTGLKDKYRKPPVKDDDNPYMFFPATDRAKDNFLDEMKKQKLAELENPDQNLDRIRKNSQRDDTESELIEDDKSKDENPPIETEDLESGEEKSIEEIKSDITIEQEEETKEEPIENKNLEIKTENLSTDEKTKLEKEKLENEKQEKENLKSNEIKKETDKKTDIKKEEKIEEIKLDDKKKEEKKKTEKEEETEKIEYEEEEEG